MRIPFLPPPGLNSDSTSFAAPGVWNNGSNVRFFHGHPQSLGGETTLQSGAAEVYSAVRKLFAYKVGSTAYLVVARDINTDSSLQIVNTTTWARTNIGPAADLSGTIRYSFAMFGDILMVVPKDDTLYTSTAGATAAAVANAPDNITTMLVTPSRQVMALGCNEEVSATFNGRCIRWSDIEDYTDWTTASSNNAGEYILPGQENIVGAALLGDYIVVWTTGAVWLGQYLGNPGETYRFTRIDGVGLIAQDCWAILHGTVYWMSPDLKFYGYRIGGLPFEIPCPIWNTEVMNADDVASRPYYNALAVRRFGEIWFSIGGVQLAAGKSMVYCVDESAAAQRPVWFTAFSFSAAVDDPVLAGGLNMVDSTSIYTTTNASVNKTLKAFDIQSASGSIPSWSIESSFFYMEEGKRRVQVQKIVDDVLGAYGSSYGLRLTTSDYPNSSATTDTYTIPNTSVGRTDLRTSGKLVAVEFYDSDGTSSFTDPWRMGKPVFEVVLLGNR